MTLYNRFDLLHYKVDRISVNSAGSYKDSPASLKNKKRTLNLKINDENCFQYAINAALDYK